MSGREGACSCSVWTSLSPLLTYWVQVRRGMREGKSRNSGGTYRAVLAGLDALRLEYQFSSEPPL